MKKNRLITASLSLILAFGSLPAMAKKPVAVLEEITVTANKMKEDILKVPQGITVIGKTEIEEKGLKTSMDVLDQIPGMLSSPNHGVGVTFRGLKRSMFTQNNPVVMYIDGVPIVNAFGFDLSLVDVERIEVLRGPQGTLYGKDAIGAVINIITNDPENTWHGKINTEYGRWNTWLSQANINGPIMEDKLFLGIGGQYNKSDGWIKNEYPGMNKDAGRNNNRDLSGYLLFTPTDRLRVRLSASNFSHSIHSLNEYLLPPGSAPGDFDRDKTEHLLMDMETNEKVKTNAQGLTISYDLGRFRLESITTRRMRDIDGVYDADSSAGTFSDGLVQFRDAKLTSWTEELRLASTNTTGLRWVGGLYLDKEKEHDISGMQMPKEWMTPSPVDMEQQAVSDMETKTQAVFGQTMLPLGQSFELTLGGRYQRVHKTMHQGMYFLPVQGPTHGNITNIPPASSLNPDTTWNTFLPKVALAWFLSDRYTAYASFSKGYMPGGFNYFAMPPNPPDKAMQERIRENTFEPQKSTNYEIGIKADHDTWRFNATAFYMDITDIHIVKTIGNLWLTDNADKAHSLGVELEGTWQPINGLELSAGLSLMRAKYDDFDLGSVQLNGKHMEESPGRSLHFSASYHHPGGLYGRVDSRTVGNLYYYDGAAQTMQKTDPYTLVNARLGWLYKDWDIYAFIRNLTDEKYINAFKSSPMTGATAGFGDPRTFGIGVSYTF